MNFWKVQLFRKFHIILNKSVENLKLLKKMRNTFLKKFLKIIQTFKNIFNIILAVFNYSQINFRKILIISKNLQS